MRIVAYIDGSSAGNPGEAGYGIVLKDERGEILNAIGRHIGKATNNEAEYQALIGCLELVKPYQPQSLAVYSDSQLLVNQVKGIYRVKHPRLKVLHTQIIDEVNAGTFHFEISYIQRERNKEADILARRAVRLRSDIED